MDLKQLVRQYRGATLPKLVGKQLKAMKNRGTSPIISLLFPRGSHAMVSFRR